MQSFDGDRIKIEVDGEISRGYSVAVRIVLTVYSPQLVQVDLSETRISTILLLTEITLGKPFFCFPSKENRGYSRILGRSVI